MEQKYSVKLKSVAEQMGFRIVNQASDYEEIEVTSENLNRPGLQLAGVYDYFNPDRLQLIGKIETGYLERFASEEKRIKFERLLCQHIPALIICHDVEPMPECLEMAKKYDTTVFKTERDTSELIVSLIGLLQEHLAPRITRHGVFIEVYGEGLLLIGESGVGKSEAAVELIKRGHRLIADDAVEIKKIGVRTLIGSAPDLIRYYIELRGIGVVDVRQIFGAGAVKLDEKIDLIVNLEAWKDGMNYARLGTEEDYTNILDVEVPTITIPIRPGRNLAVILEVAAMNNRQKKMGYNAALAFTEKINRYFEAQTGGGN